MADVLRDMSFKGLVVAVISLLKQLNIVSSGYV